MQRSRCTELQANQKAVLQNLRMQFNRRCCTAGWVDGHLRRNWSCSKCLDEYWNELEQGRSDTAASAATIEAHNKLEAAAGAGPLACSAAGLWGHRASARGCSKKESCKNLRIGINRPRRKPSSLLSPKTRQKRCATSPRGRESWHNRCCTTRLTCAALAALKGFSPT